MTTQLLASELTNLIQESKRKHNDLRLAAEKSLEELKTIKASNEAQAAAELSQRPNFVNPFIIACGTKNVKFTGIAIVCLQRLIVSRALPRTKLDQALEALREATSAGLDVQLKILQALPSLLQNYASDLRGDLLITTLNICFVLQTSKNAIVNNTSAATLQQLVVSVFDKVVAEDKAGNVPPAGEAPTSDGTVELRPAALDAYRVFNDLCLMTENQRPEYLRFSGLPQTFGLELIESVLTNHTSIFLNHPEQTHVLRVRVMPFIIGALRGKPNFATTVRLVRILYTLLRRHLNVLTTEGGDALDILTHLLDQDTALWKRALCMEVFRGIFSEHALVRRIFALYDAREGEIPILKNLTATFVRLSTERPAVIGLGHQSSIPVSNPYGNAGVSSDHVMLDSSGVTGIISTGSSESSNTGISTQWSHVRVPCIDQLDKTEAPPIPESYIYSLALSCVSSFSEGLAKFILPLTVPADGRNRRRNTKLEGGRDSPAPSEGSPHPLGPRGQLERAGSFKKNPVPRNPLSLEDHPLYSEVKICAAIVDECWPAFLATCSTFLYAALDSEYYHGLVRAFQRFAHVAGLLQLTTPRDAFLTTLGKAAVPPNVITACLNMGSSRPQNTEAPSTSNSILSNAKGLLSVDSLVAPSSASDRGRQASFDTSGATLTTRNLLCLRALLNLGIALGPTLHSSWRIILETLQQADFVLFTTHKTPGRTPTVSRSSDQVAENEANTLLSNFASETRAVETAASRLIESTVDFPNDAFVQVVDALCELLGRKRDAKEDKHEDAQSPPSTGGLKAPANQHARSSSVSVSPAGPNQENQFALAKLGDLATINIERLLSYDPADSGWDLLITELIRTLNSQSANASVRLRAADILVRLALESANVAGSLGEEERGGVQLQVLQALRDALLPLQSEDREVSVATHSTDVDIHKAILDGVKNLLENCGETLVSGWDVAFQIIGSIFLQKHISGEDRKDNDVQSTALVTRSAKLVRSSFSSLQLICSDFLAALPNSCFLILVDTLYKFCSQDDDLNIALTTVTFFWVLSDFLSGQNKTMSITEDLMQGAGVADLVAKASQSGGAGSNAALWMLLLLRLTTVTNDDRLELRNSAIQTLLRIFDAYGDNLNPEAWYTCVKHVIFRLLSSIEEELEAVDDDPTDEDRKEWHDTSVIVLNGISELLATYLDVLSKHPSFNELWRELLQHFTTLLNFKALEINTALFKALGKVVSPEHHANRSIFDKETVEAAWLLWSSGIPVLKEDGDAADNQNCLIAYVGAFDDVYRLVRADLTVDKVRQILTLFREALQTATIGNYVNDSEYATPLQTRVLEAIKKIRTDLDGVPAVMITQVAEFVQLPFPETPSQTQGPPPKRTFVALSKGSMSILQELVLAHASDTDVYASSALAAALSSLARPIKLKYRFPIVTKTSPWQLATNTALAILDATLPHLHGPEVPRATIQRIWELIVEIADGIITAEWEAAPAAANVANDQAFDMNAFRRLRDLIMPGLGSEVIPDTTRKAYAESLFRTSIIHRPSPGEMSLIYGTGGGGDGAGLSALYKRRPGRTIDPEPTAREKMSYVCLDELFSLVAAYDEPSGPTIVVQPPTPRFPPPGRFGAQQASENPQALHVRTARTAAPFLIFRAALPLRSFVADQPLRGRMPQPLGQRRELLRVLQNLVDLRSQPEAIPDTPNVDCEGRKHLLRLYPLLVGTVRVAGAAGDDGVLGIASEALEVVGGELGV
ncbi:endosomal peripheral membrane protein [Plectosphaerella cucumerina]|uniref:Endosomal peripheral membrane protein n=1 Tax=Plectosphaerella cucumerina TaxID=40658 RepID=A0A8K0X6D1_9PEZI|nr:endosomal peripheral membrane protein [Plectosphaerella cucumerina]